MESNSANKQAYSVEEAAKQLSVGRNAIYDLLNGGELKSLRIGARRLIPASEISNLLSRAEASTGSPKAR